jgi:uncharacterized protein (TIGR02598 family)
MTPPVLADKKSDPAIEFVLGGRRKRFFVLMPPSAIPAFTLVEVTLALGIVAFAFVALLGMIPVGLKTSRKAMEASTGSQIVQRVVAQVKAADYTNLATTNYSFDDQANVTTNNAQKIYDARVTVTKGVTLPDSPQANMDLARVTVEVVNNAGRLADPFAANSNGVRPNVKVYSAYITRSTPGP